MTHQAQYLYFERQKIKYTGPLFSLRLMLDPLLLHFLFLRGPIVLRADLQVTSTNDHVIDDGLFVSFHIAKFECETHTHSTGAYFILGKNNASCWTFVSGKLHPFPPHTKHPQKSFSFSVKGRTLLLMDVLSNLQLNSPARNIFHPFTLHTIEIVMKKRKTGSTN